MLCPSCHEDKLGWPDLWCNDLANPSRVLYICFDCAHAHQEAIVETTQSVQALVGNLSYQFGRMTMMLMHVQRDLTTSIGASPNGRPTLEAVDSLRTELTNLKQDVDSGICMANSLLGVLGKKET